MTSWAKQIGLRRPQSKIEWAVLIGLFFIIIAFFVRRSVYVNSDELELQPQIAAYGSYVLKKVGLAIIATSSLIFGIQRLRIGVDKTRGYLVTILATLMFLFFIAKPAINIIKLTYFQDIRFSKEVMEQRRKERANPEMSLVSRGRINKWIAEQVYLQDGISTEYIDSTGNHVTFQPSEENIQRRKLHLIMPTMLRTFKIEIAFWATVFIGSAIAGYAGYRRREEKQTS